MEGICGLKGRASRKRAMWGAEGKDMGKSSLAFATLKFLAIPMPMASPSHPLAGSSPPAACLSPCAAEVHKTSTQTQNEEQTDLFDRPQGELAQQTFVGHHVDHHLSKLMAQTRANKPPNGLVCI